MKANRLILTLKTDKGDELRQATVTNLHMTGTNLYYTDLRTKKNYAIPIKVIDRIDTFFIDVDPFTYEPVLSSSVEA